MVWPKLLLTTMSECFGWDSWHQDYTPSERWRCAGLRSMVGHLQRRKAPLGLEKRTLLLIMLLVLLTGMRLSSRPQEVASPSRRGMSLITMGGNCMGNTKGGTRRCACRLLSIHHMQFSTPVFRSTYVFSGSSARAAHAFLTQLYYSVILALIPATRCCLDRRLVADLPLQGSHPHIRLQDAATHARWPPRAQKQAQEGPQDPDACQQLQEVRSFADTRLWSSCTA